MNALNDGLMERADEVALNLEDGDVSEATCTEAVDVIRALAAALRERSGVVA